MMVSMWWVVRRSRPIIAAILIICFPSMRGAVAYEICDPSYAEFTELAFPQGVPFLSDHLAKWRKAPGLIVLSSQADVAEEIGISIGQVKLDGLVDDSPMEFRAYSSADEIGDVAREFGVNNVFVVIDSSAFKADPRNEELRRVVTDLLLSLRISDRLFEIAKKNQQWSIQNRVNLESGEVYTSVVLVNPAIGPVALTSLVYRLYYAAVSPPATYRVKEFFEQVFDQNNPSGIGLTKFAAAYYRVVLDTRVPIGAGPDYFKECNR